MVHVPICTARLYGSPPALSFKMQSSVTRRGFLGACFTESVGMQRKKYAQSKTLLTVNNQYINNFMKKLIIYIIQKCAFLNPAKGRSGG